MKKTNYYKNHETDNRTNDELFWAPVLTTVEAALDLGFKPNDIHTYRIGSRTITIVYVPSSKEMRDECLRSLYRDLKAESRGKRCMISGKRGRIIRCPDANSCGKCPYHYSLEKKSFSEIPFSALSHENDYGDIIEYDPPAPANYNLSDFDGELLEGFIKYATQKNKIYGIIVSALIEGKSLRQVAAEIGKGKSTVIECGQKIRQLIPEYIETLT